MQAHLAALKPSLRRRDPIEARAHEGEDIGFGQEGHVGDAHKRILHVGGEDGEVLFVLRQKPQMIHGIFRHLLQQPCQETQHG